MKKKSLERSCKGVKRWKDMIWKKWIKCDIIVKSYMKSMNIYSKYMDLNFGIVTFLVFEPIIREIWSFDERKSWFNQIWDLLKYIIFSPGPWKQLLTKNLLWSWRNRQIKDRLFTIIYFVNRMATSKNQKVCNCAFFG